MACNLQAAIDLHIHSSASDGTLGAHQILKQAQALGLRAVSITDHDTTRGSAAALQAEIPTGLAVISGVEISTAPPPGFGLRGSFHLLGYGFEPNDAKLESMLRRLRRARRERNPQIVARLGRLGVALDLEAIAAEAGADGQVGRPHLAAGMVAAGVVPDVETAFDRFLARGRPAYVDKYRVPCTRAIERVRGAGGIAVMAHPGLLPIDPGRRFERLVAGLRELGLGGIEAYYSEHTPQQREAYRRIARRFDLLVTGGSDFHGAVNPGVRMGRGRGDLSVPYALYEALAARISARRACGGAPGAAPYR